MDSHLALSYSHDDNARLVTSLLNRLGFQLRPAIGGPFTVWSDREITAGGNWDEAIRNMFSSCRLGVLLVSPAFLSSDYIHRVELPALRASGKTLIPVALERFDFKLHNLKGLDVHQFHFLNRIGFDRPRAYSQCDSRQKHEFVDLLFAQIMRRL